ncbi:hypothetical protein QQG55_31160 [Brugia pahangi]
MRVWNIILFICFHQVLIEILYCHFEIAVLKHRYTSNLLDVIKVLQGKNMILFFQLFIIQSFHNNYQERNCLKLQLRIPEK